MNTSATLDRLGELIRHLEEERQSHLEAIEGIDESLRRYGIDPEGPTSGGASGGASEGAPSRRRRRGRFNQTAEQFILDLLGNGKTLTTAEINEAWSRAGRAGRADTTLTRMIKNGKLERENIQGARGSRISRKD